MKKNIIIGNLLLIVFLISSCSDVLDRPELNNMNDDTYWRNETDLRLFTNGFYINYFVGYNNTWGVAYAPLRGYYFSDDFSNSNVQSNFESSAPSSRGSTSETPDMLIQYAGPNWNFAWVRKSNLLINRIENVAKPQISSEAYNHWMGVARFFKGYEYHRLVSVFGNVPYYEALFESNDLDMMYQDRTPRGEVMDHVYDDLMYAFQNVRLDDGNNVLNRYIVAGFISRFMLFEGTWQKYHLNDQVRAKKYLELAITAGDFVINSGKYNVTSNFRSLFGSQDLKGNPEMLMYRHYDAAQSVTHHVASYSNGYESQIPSANLSLAKSFLCVDGQPYKLSTLENSDVLDIKNMIKTRDPRFEATFQDVPKVQSATLLYASKFIDRTGPTFWNSGNIPPMYASMTNTNDAPVMRYSEVLLNWIEAKAELATMGGAAVTQTDINNSINKIRNRPLETEAIAKGVQKTAPMSLAALPDDPDRDPDVSPLLWEIRRERRMEFVFEYSRLLDIKRWKKINYMSATQHPDNLLGLWINVKEELPSLLVKEKVGLLKVKKADGTVVSYNGTNGDEMVGFYMIEKGADRQAFDDKVYLAPVGKAQIDQYKDKGYTLTQTPGWN
ncbi:MAG: glycan metabolism protein RagB [Bacteroidetes bacterium GWD2_45_23]|nr:MAG: glycan metabolism protein RagB [Bacteroidetes bacterium GWC2_46_850]OFX73615.1 MAG: glycan metabolism protein RagB [Bacteroidetes bacterium GWC1_47_7]OFX84706.1 MAG: glycan metabolism protein RagB [Bacteroidetes bacterium GWD2_45_23]HAR38900.1 RagB/SusD family nutrient uptake outer membrane protein [Porphyromonadaceae bacterium]HBB00574.1 RagB/SusD family nutrient uptake outer membrane protein [Porphyromonadaceae bacterium]